MVPKTTFPSFQRIMVRPAELSTVIQRDRTKKRFVLMPSLFGQT